MDNHNHENGYCPYCGRRIDNGGTRIDHGDKICSACGLVLREGLVADVEINLPRVAPIDPKETGIFH